MWIKCSCSYVLCDLIGYLDFIWQAFTVIWKLQTNNGLFFLYVHYFMWVDIVSHCILFTTLFCYVELKMEFLISGMTGIIRFVVPTCPGKSLKVLEFLLQILGLWNILENHCGPWKSWKLHHDMIVGTAGIAISFNLTSLLCHWVALCTLNI